jgi:chaperonin GroES
MSLSKSFKKLVPLMNRVLIKKMEPVNESKSGIILSTKVESPNVGTVVAVGEGSLNEKGQRLPLLLQTGNVVLLPDFGGQKLELADGEYFLFRDSEILGVLEKN